MTRSGDRQRQQSDTDANAPLPSSLAFVVHIQPPPHLFQPDFKAHRRKTSAAGETPKVSSPLASKSAASSIDAAIVPPAVPPRPKISSSPKRVEPVLQKRPTKPVQQRTPTPRPRPKSVFESPEQSLPRDWYRPRSVEPSRTQIRHDSPSSVGGLLLYEKNRHGVGSSPVGISSLSSQHRIPNRSVPTLLPSEAALKPQSDQSFGGQSSSEGNVVSNPRSNRRQQADETELPTMVGAGKETIDEGSASGRLLIKGGQVVNDDAIVAADVFVEDGIIKQVGPNLAVPGGARVVDVKGKYIFPGGIDAQTHFQLPFMGATTVDDYYSGTKAAVAGGTTMIIGSVLPNKGESLLSAYEKWRGWADSKVCCDYGLSVGVTHWSDKVGDEMGQLASKGVNSFKFFMAYKDLFMLHDEELYRGFQQCKKIGAVARVHAENGDLVAMKQKEVLAAGVTGPEGHVQAHPEELEIEATTRACVIARQVNCPLYILNVMSKGAADAIGDARRRGSAVVGESIAAGLITDGGHYFDKSWRHAASYVTAPPLRLDSSTPKYLMQMLAGGDLHVSASAHRAFNSGQKASGKDDFTKIPHGVNGVEERMMALWERGVNTGRMDMMRFVAVTSTNAAKIFNIYPKKGRIAEGSDADIVVWDPHASKVVSVGSHSSQSDYNIFEGLVCHGIPYITIAGGKVVFEDGQVHVTQGAGKYVPMPPNSPHVFASVAARDHASRPVKVDRDSVDTAKMAVDSNNGSNTNTAASSPQIQRRAEQYIEPLMPATSRKDDDFHGRPMTKAGSRNMQDSTFAISGAQIDDDQASKRSTRVSNPPGGKSRGLW